MQETQSITAFKTNWDLVDKILKHNIEEPIQRLRDGNEQQWVSTITTLAKGAFASVTGYFPYWVGAELTKAVAHEYKDNDDKVIRTVSKIVINTTDLAMLTYVIYSRKAEMTNRQKFVGTAANIPDPGKEEETPQTLEEWLEYAENNAGIIHAKKVATSILKRCSFIEPFHIDGPVIVDENGDTLHIEQWAEKHGNGEYDHQIVEDNNGNSYWLANNE